MRVGSLFAGIGGFDLAARWMGWETAWFSEIDPYASAVLRKHWPGVPNHGDIRSIDYNTVEPVDLLCGGFPCQDISNAGKREGITGARSSLWKEFARAIRELRPRWVVIENVAALAHRGLDTVLGDLAEIGYDAEWGVLSAADVGANHQRKRLWVVAYTASPRLQDGGCEAGGAARDEAWRAGPDGLGDEVADAERERTERGREGGSAGGSDPGGVGDPYCPRCGEQCGTEPVSPQLAALERGSWWRVEPDVGRVAHGVPRRVDRLKCLGNAIVPHCAFEIFQEIHARIAYSLENR